MKTKPATSSRKTSSMTSPGFTAPSLVEKPTDVRRAFAFGLTVKQRAQVVLFVTLVVAVIALGVSTARTSNSAESVQIFVDAQATSDSGRLLETELWRLESAIWRLESSADRESAREVSTGLKRVSDATVDAESKVVKLTRHQSVRTELASWKNAGGEKLFDEKSPLFKMRTSVGRLRSILSMVLDAPERLNEGEGENAVRKAHFLVSSLTKDSGALARQARKLVGSRASAAETAVSNVSRDQLVLLLVVLFALPVASWFGARWICEPLNALRVLTKKIAANRVRDIDVSGRDEIASISRELKDVLTKLSANEKRQREKIFEMRRILRAIIDPVHDAVLILGKAQKIDYANAQAAQLLAKGIHNLETASFDEVLFSPALSDAVERAWEADLEESGIDASIEVHDGRLAKVHASLRSVRDQQGRIARVVLVMSEC